MSDIEKKALELDDSALFGVSGGAAQTDEDKLNEPLSQDECRQYGIRHIDGSQWYFLPDGSRVDAEGAHRWIARNCGSKT